nr:alpha/beta fold hydrolase [Chromobacterium sp. ASV5]
MMHSLGYPLLWLWAGGHQRYNRLMARLGRKPPAVAKVRIRPETHYRRACDQLRRLDMALLWRCSRPRLARLVIGLFETALRTQGKASEQRFLDGLRREWLPLDDGGAPVYLAGDPTAPAVLVAHGWEGRAGMMQTVCQPLLDAGYRIILPELYAHGGADGRSVSFFALANQLRRAEARYGPAHCVVGHSAGGLIAALAIQDGLRCRRLATIGAPFSLRRLLRRHFDLCRLSAAQQAYCLGSYRARYGLSEADLDAGRWASIAQPWLVCHDRYDQTVPLAEAEAAAALAPGARLCLTRGGGHLGVLRNPQLLAALRAFVDEERP